jgi:hypothetical protein
MIGRSSTNKRCQLSGRSIKTEPLPQGGAALTVRRAILARFPSGIGSLALGK